MYNTGISNSLPSVSAASGLWFTLTPVGSTQATDAVQFLINPDEESWKFSGDYNKIAVLATGQPLINYKSSDSVYSLPKVRLYSPDNDKNLQHHIDKLKAFTQPGKDGKPPPLLKLTYGELMIPQVYLSNVELTIKARIGGSVAMAEGKMDFLIVPIPPKVEVAEPPPASSVSANSVLSKQTTREQGETLQKLTGALLDNQLGALSHISTEDKKTLSTIKKADLPQYTPQLFAQDGISVNIKGEFVLNKTVVYTADQVKQIAGVDLSASAVPDKGDVTINM